MKLNAVSYARFSSANQREASIEIQQEHIRKYCEESGLTIIKEYVDRAMSATSDNRPQFQQMMKDAESGLFTFVIVYNSSRFCRNIQDHLKYRSLLETYGVRLVCVNDNFDETTPEGDLMSNFMMSINQYYSKDLARKTSLGMLETAKECKHVGGIPPYGYYVDSEQNYHINEEEAKAVRLIFQMIDDGYTYKEICDELDKRGFKTRKGQKFHRDFSGMIKNRKYLGEFVWNRTNINTITGVVSDASKGDVVRIPGGMPRIIEDEQYYRVIQKINERRKNYPVEKENETLLTSIIKCGKCGYKMTLDRNSNGNGTNTWVREDYRCFSTLKGREPCDTKPVRMKLADTYIINLINNVLLNERYYLQIYRLIKEKIGQDYQALRAEMLENQITLNKTKDEIRNLVNSLAEAKTIVYQEILKEIERLSLLKTDLEGRNKVLAKQLDEFPVFDADTIQRNILRLRSTIKGELGKYYRQIIHLLIKEIEVTNEEFSVKVNLNAYLSKNAKTRMEISIVEDTKNVRNLAGQTAQNLSWTALTIRV